MEVAELLTEADIALGVQPFVVNLRHAAVVEFVSYNAIRDEIA